MKKIICKVKLQDEEIDKLIGQYPTDDTYDTLINEDCDGYNEEGKLLFRFRKNCIPTNVAKQAYPFLRKAGAVTSNNRGQSAGPFDNVKVGDKVDGLTVGKLVSGNRFIPLKKDGTYSNSPKAKQVRSNVIGYLDRVVRIPFCRTTEYTRKHFEEYKSALPFIKAIDDVYRINEPEKYAIQKGFADKTSQDFVIKGTAFTTVTVNKNFKTACHYDKGDLPNGFGNLAVLQAGDYDGSYTVMPKYGVAFDVRSCDVCLFDVHELHGNTPITSKGYYERIAIVCYYRTNMEHCGNAQQELEKAKHRQVGDKIK